MERLERVREHQRPLAGLRAEILRRHGDRECRVFGRELARVAEIVVRHLHDELEVEWDAEKRRVHLVDPWGHARAPVLARAAHGGLVGAAVEGLLAAAVRDAQR